MIEKLAIILYASVINWAEILSVHPNTLRLWDKKGILKAVRIGEKKIRRYRLEDIKKFISGNLQASLIKKK